MIFETYGLYVHAFDNMTGYLSSIGKAINLIRGSLASQYVRYLFLTHYSFGGSKVGIRGHGRCGGHSKIVSMNIAEVSCHAAASEAMFK